MFSCYFKGTDDKFEISIELTIRIETVEMNAWVEIHSALWRK
jgi:hypothetical protein